MDPTAGRGNVELPSSSSRGLQAASPTALGGDGIALTQLENIQRKQKEMRADEAAYQHEVGSVPSPLSPRLGATSPRSAARDRFRTKGMQSPRCSATDGALPSDSASSTLAPDDKSAEDPKADGEMFI